MKVRKIVIPAAGFGTRFLPATKAQPKEMLPIVDKPIIQYVVEEAVQAGIEEVILITGSTKRPIEDHFDYNFELEYRLKQAGKDDMYKEIRRISDMAKFVYVRQKEQLGNGHAVLMAKEVIGDEPFIVMWGDEFVYADPVSRTKQLMETFNQYHSSIISAMPQTEPADANKYAFVKGIKITDQITKLDQVVEKPGPGKEPSNLIVPGGYLLMPTIFDALEEIKPGKGGEIWLADAINLLAKREAVYSLLIQNGIYYDCGNKLGYLKSNVEFALRDPDVSTEFLRYLKKLIR